jgi:hypothetical protein
VLRNIVDLQRIQATLSALIAACEGHGSTDDCPILHALEDHPSEPSHSTNDATHG